MSYIKENSQQTGRTSPKQHTVRLAPWRQCLLLLLVPLMWAMAAPAHAALPTLTYEIYDIIENGEQVLIANGSKRYQPEQVQVITQKEGDETFWLKQVPLDKGYALGVTVHRDKLIDGIALWVDGPLCGFSWDFFLADKSGHFIKRLGASSLSVQMRKVGDLQEVAEIRFDTDVWLKISTQVKLGNWTQYILIREGSVLQLPLPEAGVATPPHKCKE